MMGLARRSAAWILAGGALALAGTLPAAAPLGAGETGAPAARVAASLDSASVTVGSVARLAVRVELPPGYALEGVELDGPPGKVEVRGREAGEAGAVFLLASFEVGDHPLPPPVARVRAPDGRVETARGDSLTLRVRSVLPAGADSVELRALRGLEPLPRPGFPWRWALAGLGVLAAAAALLLWLRRRRGRRRAAPAAPAAPPVPAEEAALAALAALRAKRLPAQGLLDPFYVELTAIVRTYLGARYAFDAMDMTTGEIERELGRRLDGDADEAARRRAARLLESGDLVKFAKGRPAAEVAEEALSEAEGLVAMTTPRPALP